MGAKKYCEFLSIDFYELLSIDRFLVNRKHRFLTVKRNSENTTLITVCMFAELGFGRVYPDEDE